MPTANEIYDELTQGREIGPGVNDRFRAAADALAAGDAAAMEGSWMDETRCMYRKSADPHNHGVDGATLDDLHPDDREHLLGDAVYDITFCGDGTRDWYRFISPATHIALYLWACDRVVAVRVEETPLTEGIDGQDYRTPDWTFTK